MIRGIYLQYKLIKEYIMQLSLTNSRDKIKAYIENNAAKFDFTALFKMLYNLGYALNDIKFISSESLRSPNSYIENIEFKHESIDIHINDINTADFLNKLKCLNNYDYRLGIFFSSLISKIIFEYTTSVYPEGKDLINNYYDNGNSTIAPDDANLKSFAFIYSFIENLFSEYNTTIFLKSEGIFEKIDTCTLGTSLLDENCIVGNIIERHKEFIVIRFITETFIDAYEYEMIQRRLEIFKKYFFNIMDSICIITENQITDEDLYSILPINLEESSVLIQNLVRLNKAVLK
jgi:hypothetical protein